MCPKQALKASDKMNEKGYVLPVEDDMARCNACRQCEILCPDFAIAIESDDD
jgi:2-oxoglutarate ferredoxin oxidoreductase subunit delta